MTKRRTFAPRTARSLVVALLLLPDGSRAASVTGRLTLGSYVGVERLTESSAGNNSNDVATVSGRFFVRVADVGSNRFEFVSDVRDKNDFFGLLDKQRLSLTPSNTLQIHQLSAKYPGPVLFTQIGRFPVPEAGAVFADGALQGVHFSKSVRLALFAGLNPKRPEQTHLQFNRDSQVFGSFLSFTPPYQLEGSSLSVDTAAVADIVRHQTDRVYWYTNTVFNWNDRGRVSLLTYLDFVPRAYLQNGTMTVHQGIGRWLLELNAFSIDVLEYQRRQSVRETLPSSPYREVSGRARYQMSDTWSLELAYSSGYRQADGLARRQTTLTSEFPRALGRRWDLALAAGYRNNFSSYDVFGQVRINYNSNLWDVGLEENYQTEQYKNGGPKYHPLTSELSISRIFENSLYGTIALQDVRDERVKITSLFVKLSYRFGSREIPPVRDGAPPRGSL